MQKKYVALMLGLVLLLPLNIYADEGGEVGDTPPNFTLRDIKGNTHTLYDYFSNSAVLVYFWNYRGCGHPQGKLDSLQKKLYNVYHSQGLEILAINCRDGKDVTQYWANVFNIIFPMLYVEGAQMEALLEAYEIPVAADLKSLTDELIDPSDTTIYYRARPPAAKGIGPLEPKVKELIAKNGIGEIPLSKSFWLSSYPFYESIKLRLYLSKPSDISLTLFNAIGCLIQRRNLGLLSAGEHSVQWSSKNFAPGVYFLHIKAGDLSEIQKMVVIK